MRQKIIILIGILIILLILFTLLKPKPKSKITHLVKEIKPKVGQESLTIASQKNIKKEFVKSSFTFVKKDTSNLVSPLDKKESLESKPMFIAITEEDTEKWGEDPFVRDFSYIAEIKSLVVSAITIGENEAYAIMNNRIIHVGDVINGKRVLAIEKDRVILEKGGKRFVIFLGE